MTRLALISTAIAALTALSCAAQTNLATNGDFSNGTKGWTVSTGAGPQIIRDLAEDAPASQALRLTLSPQPGSVPWSVRLSQSVRAFMDEGDRLTLKLWMRSPDNCRVGAHVEENSPPYQKSLSRVIQTTPQWREYEIAGNCRKDFSSGAASVVFHLGYDSGTIEIADIRLFNPDLDKRTGGKRPTVDNPTSLIDNGDFSEDYEETWYFSAEPALQVEQINVDVDEYSKGVRLRAAPPEDAKPWELDFGQQCTGYIHPGDAVYFRAWLRSPDACRVAFIYELAEPPHTKVIHQTVKLTPEWKEYRFGGRPDRGFRPGESQAKFFLGYDEGIIELTGIRVHNFGPAEDKHFDQTIDYWAGQEHPDTWREPALQRIDDIRKGDLQVTVVDGNGDPVAGADVSVKQQRHHFRFGTALPAGRLIDDTNPDNLRFQKEVERLFNTVTFENDLKWVAMSERRLEAVDRATMWLRERDIQIRGHCLLWGSYRHLHPSVRDLRGQQLYDACKQHVAEYASRMDGTLYVWDVVNEAGTNTEVWDEIGWEAFAESFRWAREADPDVLLCYNENGIIGGGGASRSVRAERTRYLFDHDAPVDVLGIQSHMGLPLKPIHRVLEILDEWAEFGLPLEIAEFDLGLKDDEMHGQYVRDFLIAAFSHPSVEAFIMWGFWEGSHWRSDDGAAMFTMDWTKRPAQEAYEKLVFDEWWTDWSGKTDADGAATVDAFYGDYEISAQKAENRATQRTAVVPDGPREVVLTLD